LINFTNAPILNNFPASGGVRTANLENVRAFAKSASTQEDKTTVNISSNAQQRMLNVTKVGIQTAIKTTFNLSSNAQSSNMTDTAGGNDVAATYAANGTMGNSAFGQIQAPNVAAPSAIRDVDSAQAAPPQRLRQQASVSMLAPANAQPPQQVLSLFA